MALVADSIRLVAWLKVMDLCVQDLALVPTTLVVKYLVLWVMVVALNICIILVAQLVILVSMIVLHCMIIVMILRTIIRLQWMQVHIVF